MLSALYDASPAQAVELARALGGEAERLTLALHTAREAAAQIEALRARTSAAYSVAWARGERRIAYRRHEALCALLEAGAEHWRAEADRRHHTLRALEVSR